jgi:hypothetical protein
LAALVAAVVAAAFFCFAPSSFRGRCTDYTEYYSPVAAAVLNGQGLIMPDAAPATRQPPGYPLTLAGTYWVADALGCDRERAVDWASSAWFVCGVVALWWLTSLLWGQWPAAGVGVLWCTYLPVVSMLGQAGSELPFVPLLFATLGSYWLASRRRTGRWFLLGIAGVGCAVLVQFRPIALGVTGVLGLLLLAQRGTRFPTRLVSAAVFAVGFLLGVGPWEIWLYRQCGEVVPLSTNGPRSMYDGLTFAVRNSADDRSSIALPAGVVDLQRALDADWQSGRAATTGGLVSAFARHAADSPAAAVELLVIKAARCWYGTDSRRHETVLLLLAIPYALIVVPAVIRALSSGGAGRAFSVLVLGVVICNWVMATVVLSIFRYMVPTVGLLFALTPALLPRARLH